MKIKAKKLASNAILPKRQRDGDVGFDLYVSRVEDCGDYIKVYSGVAVEPPKRIYLDLVARSSIYKKNLRLSNGFGVLDNNFRGEIVGIFDKINNQIEKYGSVFGSYDPEREEPEKFTFEIGERFAQLIPRTYFDFDFVEVEELADSVRGKDGFGSSGSR